MRRVFWTPLVPASAPEGFGHALRAHLTSISAPKRQRESLCAWSLLAAALEAEGIPLREVTFDACGKPRFAEGGPGFSLSHGGGLCAVSLGDGPTGVDVEPVDRSLTPALRARLRTPGEEGAELDDVALWCLKESLIKCQGTGWTVLPAKVDTTAACEQMALRRVEDSGGRAHWLAAAFEGPREDVLWTELKLKGR